MPEDHYYPLRWLSTQAKEQPRAPAIIYQSLDRAEDVTIYYEDLEKEVHSLATHLKTKHSSQCIVGVCLPRGPEYIIWMLAAWKAGMIYMPFVDYPDKIQADLAMIIEHLKIATQYYDELKPKQRHNKLALKPTPHLLITHDPKLFSSMSNTPNVEVICYKLNKKLVTSTQQQSNSDLSFELPSPTDPAYICCSSGTTAKPKLILNNYSGFIDRVQGLTEQLMESEGNHCVLGFAGFDFDASIMDALMALYRGASLYIVPNYVKQHVYEELPNLFERAYKNGRPITTAVLMPSVLKGAEGKGFKPERFQGLRSLVTMGDVCKDEWLGPWLDAPQVQVFNGYGPTEATIAATLAVLNKAAKSTLLGRPLPGVTIYLVEPHAEPEKRIVKATITPKTNPDELLEISKELKQGSYEIYLGGDRGIGSYLDEEADKKAFLTSLKPMTEQWPFEGSERVYRTGDLAMLNGDQLLFMGRQNGLIKRNGRRVLPGVVQEVLEEKIKAQGLPIDSIYISVDGEKNKIVAWVIPTDKANEQKLAGKLYALREQIDPQLRPDLFFSIPCANFTERGKFDTNLSTLLPRAKLLHKTPSRPYSAWERKLADLWADLLLPKGLPDKEREKAILVTDNFFELGGSSLDMSTLVSQVCTKLLNRNNQEGTPSDLLNYLYRHPVLQNMAAYLDDYSYEADKSFKETGGYPPIFYLSNFGSSSFVKNDLKAINPIIYQLVPKQLLQQNQNIKDSLDLPWNSMIEQCIRTIVRHQQMGPYQLLATEKDLLFAEVLAQSLVYKGAEVYLVSHPSKATLVYRALEHSLEKWAKKEQERFTLEQIEKGKIHLPTVGNNAVIRQLNENLKGQQKAQLKYKISKHYQKLEKNIPTQITFPFLFPCDGNIDQKTPALVYIKNFLEDATKSTLFLAGPTGIGKRTLCQYLTSNWKDHIQQQCDWLPIFLDIRGKTSLESLSKTLEEEGFTNTDLEHLKNEPVVFIVAGYDETGRNDLPNFRTQFPDWNRLKLIVNCQRTLTEELLKYTWNNKDYQIVEVAELTQKELPTSIQNDNSLKDVIEELKPCTFANFTIIRELRKKIDPTSKDTFYMAFLERWLSYALKKRLWVVGENFFLPRIQELLTFVDQFPETSIGNIGNHRSPWEDRYFWESFYQDNYHLAVIEHSCFPYLKGLLLRQHHNQFIWPSWLKSLAVQHRETPLTTSHDLNELDIKVLRLNARLTHLSSPQKLQTLITNPFLVPIQTGQHLTPIFFFHPLTGTAPEGYRKLAERLGPKQPVYCFIMPEANEVYSIELPKLESLKEKVYYFSEIIQQIQPKGDLLLAGWSYGAMLAYRVAAIFEEQERKVALLLNIDCSSPPAIQEILVDERSIAIIKELPKLYSVPSIPEEVIAKIKESIQETAILPEQSLSTPSFAQIIEVTFKLAIAHYEGQLKLEQDAKQKKSLERLISGLKNSQINLKTCYQAADDNVILEKTTMHIAVPDHTSGINPGPNMLADDRWEKIVGSEHLSRRRFTGSNHYTIFNNPEFIQYFCELVASSQTRLESKDMEQRIKLSFKRFESNIPSIYIPTEATIGLSSHNRFDLKEKFQSEFLRSEYKVLLLSGSAGVGKSTFLSLLARESAERYLRRSQSSESWLPIYVKSPVNSSDMLLTTVKSMGFTEVEITGDLGHRNILFLLDDYETFDSKNINNSNKTFVKNWLNTEFLQILADDWPNAKFVLACRFEMSGTDNVPHAPVSHSGNIMHYYIPAFSKTQFDQYLTKYKHEHLSSANTNYVDKIKEYDGVADLALNPLVLKMLLDIFGPEKSKVLAIKNRTDIYRHTISLYFERSIEKLCREQGLPPGVNIEGLKESFWNYHSQLAFAKWSKGKFSDSLKRYVNTTQPIWSSSLLQHAQGSDEIDFIHATYLEFFVAYYLVNNLKTLNEENDRGHIHRIWGQKTFTNNVSLIRFLIELLDLDINIQASDELYRYVLESSSDKNDEATVIAAANAITLLNAAGKSFSGRDLQKIRIPTANLEGAILHQTNLSHADLREVNLRNTYLAEADLSYCQMEGVQFGEWSYLGQCSSVSGCAYSPDQQWLAVVCGSEMHLYNAETREHVRTFKGHSKVITGISWNNNASRIVSGSRDGTARIWDINNGQILHVLNIFNQHTGEDKDWTLFSISWSKDGKFIASGGKNKVIELWDAQTGQCLAATATKQLTSAITTVSFSKDNQLASGDRDGVIRLWDIENLLNSENKWEGRQEKLRLKPLAKVQAHVDAAIQCIDFSDDGKIASSDNPTFRTPDKLPENLNKCQKYKKQKLHKIRDKLIQNMLEQEGTIRIWNAKDLTGPLKELKEHTGWLESISWYGSDRIASGGSDNAVRLWDTNTGICFKEFRGHTSFVNGVSWKNSEVIASSGGDIVRIWDIGNQSLRNVQGHTSFITSIDCYANKIVTGSWDKTIRIWEVESGQCVKEFRGHSYDVGCVRWNKDGTRIASGDMEGIRIWDVEKGECLEQLKKGGTNHVKNINWNSVYELAVGYSDGSTWIKDRKNAKDFRQNIWVKDQKRNAEDTEESVESISWSLDNGRIAFGGSRGTIRVWNLWNSQTKKRPIVLKGHKNAVADLSWSVDGWLASAGGWDKAVGIWNPENGQFKKYDVCESWECTSVSWHNNGWVIAIGASDQTIRLWDANQGVPIQMLALDQPVRCVAFQANGYLISGQEDGTVKCWQPDTTAQKLRWQLLWSSPTQQGLCVKDCQIKGITDLSATTQELLKQRGAIVDIKQHVSLPPTELSSNKPLSRSDSIDVSETNASVSVAAKEVDSIEFLTSNSEKVSTSQPSFHFLPESAAVSKHFVSGLQERQTILEVPKQQSLEQEYPTQELNPKDTVIGSNPPLNASIIVQELNDNDQISLPTNLDLEQQPKLQTNELQIVELLCVNESSNRSLDYTAAQDHQTSSQESVQILVEESINPTFSSMQTSRRQDQDVVIKLHLESGYQAELQQLKHQLDAERQRSNSNEQKLKVLADEIQQVGSQKEQMVLANDEKQQQIAILQMQWQHHSAELNELKQQRNQAMQITNELQIELKNVQDEHEQVVAQQLQQLAVLQAQVNPLQTQVKDLQAQIRILQQQVKLPQITQIQSAVRGFFGRKYYSQLKVKSQSPEVVKLLMEKGQFDEAINLLTAVKSQRWQEAQLIQSEIVSNKPSLR